MQILWKILILIFFVNVFAISCKQTEAINEQLNLMANATGGRRVQNRFSDDSLIKHWLVLGPLPNPEIKTPLPDGVNRIGFHEDFLKSAGGEAKTCFSPGMDVKVTLNDDSTKVMSINEMEAGKNGKINLKALTKDPNPKIAYAFCYLYSLIDQQTWFHFGSDDAAKVWVNGQLVHSKWTLQRGCHRGEDKFKVQLKKGINPVMVKVDDRGSGWEFILDVFSEEDAQKVADKAFLQDPASWEIVSKEGNYVFPPGSLPVLEWKEESRMKKLLGNVPEIQVQWFGPDAQKTTFANRQGRYAAVIDTVLPDGMKLRYGLSFFCSDSQLSRKDAGLDSFKKSILPSPQLEWPITLNQDYQLKVKRKLMGIESKYPPLNLPRKKKDNSAPKLTPGTPESVGMKADLPKKLDKICRDWYRVSEKPFAIVIARHGKIVYQAGFGEVNGNKVTLNTPFEMASITKTLTAQMLAQFVDQGLINLDDPIGKFLPNFPIYGDKTIRISQCFTFNSGLKGHYLWNGMNNPYLEYGIATQLPNAKPGQSSTYSGMGHDLAGKIMEVVSGKSFFRLMHENYFQPLGVTNTTMKDCASGTRTSTLNLAKMSQLFLNKGSYGNLEFYSPEVYQAYLPKPVVSGPTYRPEFGIGLYWHKKDLSKNTVGGAAASSTIQRIDLDNDLLVCIGRFIQGKDYNKYLNQIFYAVKESIKK